MMAPDSPNLIALPLGFRLGEYRIERYLGAGGFGITYAAIDENLNQRVAIKEYLPKELAIRNADGRVTFATAEDEADFRWGLDRFLDEARALAHFDHPNIVSVKRFVEAHGTGYIVMEHVDGESLADLLKRKPTLTEAEIREHVLPLAAGLAEVHSAGLLHRDIKPSNIVIRANGVPVLIDFGSARHEASAKSRSLTAVVTPGYAPLEQYSSSQGDEQPATDIYAFGAVLYRCVTGYRPPDATDRALADRLICASEAAEGNYSPGLLTAIDEALFMRADERPPDVAAFLRLVPPTTSDRSKGEKPVVVSGHRGPRTTPHENLVKVTGPDGRIRWKTIESDHRRVDSRDSARSYDEDSEPTESGARKLWRRMKWAAIVVAATWFVGSLVIGSWTGGIVFVFLLGLMLAGWWVYDQVSYRYWEWRLNRLERKAENR